MKNISFKTDIIIIIRVLLIILCGATCIPRIGHATQNDNKKFYYFNPDSSQSNLVRLKQEMERFLQKNAFTLTFQPFAKYHDFHREMMKTSPAFVFLPEWYFRQNKKNGLQPLLQPVRKGQATYHKVLLTAKDSQLTLQGLRNKTLAMTTMGNNAPDVLDRIIFNQFKITANALNIITTPKDSDALFALAMRQVDVALVSENNLQKIGEINPHILQIVHPLAKSQPIPLPILCVGNVGVPGEKVMKLKKKIFRGDTLR